MSEKWEEYERQQLVVETEKQEEFNRVVNKYSWRFQFFADFATTDILEECRLCVKTTVWRW